MIGYFASLVLGLIAGALCAYLILMDTVGKARKRAEEVNREAKRVRDERETLRAAQAELNARLKEFAAREAEFLAKHAGYSELERENLILKRDLLNIEVNVRKLELDRELRDQRQEDLDRRSQLLAKRYLDDTVKAVVNAVGPSNFATSKNRLIDSIERCRSIGYSISAQQEEALLADLRAEFERAVRAQFQREEQARIKAQIREEERLKREIDREVRQLDRERAAIQAALDQALAEAQGRHTAEVERLQARLAEAEEKSTRALSMAQQTKAGHVYVLSNIGSFGPDVFKVGMTRRLEPQERVNELGCAAVPFPFDVHMMIQCNDAPALENALHRALHRQRINKACPRKEFFRVAIQELCEIVKQHHGAVEYIAEPAALEYRQSLTMSEEDSLFIEKVYEDAEEEEQIPQDE
jgi:hypothetical protein